MKRQSSFPGKANPNRLTRKRATPPLPRDRHLFDAKICTGKVLNNGARMRTVSARQIYSAPDVRHGISENTTFRRLRSSTPQASDVSRAHPLLPRRSISVHPPNRFHGSPPAPHRRANHEYVAASQEHVAPPRSNELRSRGVSERKKTIRARL